MINLFLIIEIKENKRKDSDDVGTGYGLALLCF
jgi:hypothetical protein